MFELPEIATLAQQMNLTIRGKITAAGQLGNSPHKFVWYNRSPQEFTELSQGRIVGEAKAKGRWLFLDLDPGYRLVIGEWGGRLQFHPKGSELPKKFHLYLPFMDGSFLTAMTQMWGAAELYEQGKELERAYIKGMKYTPIEPEFTFDYFQNLVTAVLAEKSQSAKGLLTQDQTIPGLGNSIAQDILYQARIHPRRSLMSLSANELQALYHSICQTVHACIQSGGRNDELDLFGKAGRYQRLMDKSMVGKPCKKCATVIEKIAYLGGACYFCPGCQKN